LGLVDHLLCGVGGGVICFLRRRLRKHRYDRSLAKSKKNTELPQTLHPRQSPRSSAPLGYRIRRQRLSALVARAASPQRGVRLGSSARSLARPRRPSGLPRQIGPLQFRPKFELVKKTKNKIHKIKEGDVLCTRRTYITKKERQTTLACRPFRVVVVLSCVSGVVYLCCNTLFVSFSAATECYHCVHIASLLHDFKSFSYSLSTASC
jgi:hypothetical protein